MQFLHKSLASFLNTVLSLLFAIKSKYPILAAHSRIAVTGHHNALASQHRERCMQHPDSPVSTEFVVNVLNDLCTSPLTAFTEQLPELGGCCGCFNELAERVRGSSIRAVVDRNNHIGRLCRSQPRLFSHLGICRSC